MQENVVLRVLKVETYQAKQICKFLFSLLNLDAWQMPKIHKSDSTIFCAQQTKNMKKMFSESCICRS